MKKKAYLKDCRKMFKNNFTRFISIVLIIILGTAFFVGMNAVAPAMEDDAEKYMKENNIFDISLSSNLGYKEEDIEKGQVLLLTFEKSLESLMMSLEASFGKNRLNKYIKIKFEEV